MTDRELFEAARAAAARAYAPYSGFRVGAAVLAASDAVYVGANMENASFGAAICAERVALTQALMVGERKFCALAVYAENASGAQAAWPCGICRQFLSEFGLDVRVIVGPSADALESATLAELLPHAFITF